MELICVQLILCVGFISFVLVRCTLQTNILKCESSFEATQQNTNTIGWPVEIESWCVVAAVVWLVEQNKPNQQDKQTNKQTNERTNERTSERSNKRPNRITKYSLYYTG